ncbi:acyl-CoA-binding protein [uncultured Oxalicibacterium sp.]|uniref:acyl-CoA-binding protein n=1 Tax=uncultured Oxalicibacterium sp. TaxID=1168540 RepID=UPI0025CFCA00|nr:acyl-CoA-binding protein [uncultured Oxalicibacterium sp.]
MSLQEQFEQAVADSKTLAQRPDNLTLLKIYALYKQSTNGNVEGEQPAMTDFVARAKWDAWNQLEGLSTEDAKQQYIDLITSLKD